MHLGRLCEELVGTVVFTTNLNDQLGPLASSVPGTLIPVTKHPVLRRIVLGLGTSNFARVIVGVRRFNRRVLSFLGTGSGFKLAVRVSSRHRRLLSAKKKIEGTYAFFRRSSRPFLIRGISVLSSISLGRLCSCRLRGNDITALLTDQHGASHCLLFSASEELYN